jgi:Cu-Zn family superoxide dismutase
MTFRLPHFAAACVAASLALAAQAAAQEGVRLYPLPDDAAYPEGIAATPDGRTLYTTNAATGAVFAIDLASGAVTPAGDPLGLAPGAEATSPLRSLGAKVDGRGRLWVAGGETGSMRLIDPASKRTLATFTTPGTGGLINDVAVTGEAAYFTDTRRPFLWRVAADASADAALEPWISFAGTALEYTPGANLNGIAATADGRYVIVVQMAAGRLFRIDTRSREVARIDVGAEDVTLGDGLVLAGRRLYLVRQGAGEVVTLDLGADFLTAKVVKRTSPQALAWPATAALVGDRLLIANSQFNKRASNTAVRPFSVVSIPLAAFDP